MYKFNEIRVFRIRADAEDDEGVLTAFLRSVDAQRIETAYADGAWQVLVLYQEPRRKEEQVQIQSAITSALDNWRAKTAVRVGLSAEAMLPERLMVEIARHAPTTEFELAAIAMTQGCEVALQSAAIVQVVRETMDLLSD